MKPYSSFIAISWRFGLLTTSVQALEHETRNQRESRNQNLKNVSKAMIRSEK